MLRLEEVCKRFGPKLVADQLSLTLEAGEVLALLGPSGCGKSSLLKMIAGLEQPDSGRLSFAGADLAGVAAEARRFALMFQDFALFPHLDVLGNVCFGLIEHGVARAAARQQALACLQQLGLAGMEARKVWTLSGGEQQRVALARALVTRPRLLLLDEPFSSLDADLRRQLQQEFRQQLQQAAIPAVLVTHDREEAFALADRVAVLREGRIVQCATPAQLLAAPATPWLARFIGYENVLAEGVVPEQALRLGPEQPAAAVRRIIQLADGVRVTVASADGELTLTLSAREVQQYAAGLDVGSLLHVGIDRSAMLSYSTAC
ncbi:ABC transporter ATP-binding protein [Aquitalea palustris]|uniref:ABC transporter ATP-binding protein n=1 Tax=Aquitalea palustris TaxID=2480983 RepID=A0A454JE46_9NEIS|nr:ABC transporter ATP-binding protein [Aquitalea palustris]RMC92724.1 ABC transporter ATP-binding protein [Aquitalea palustris]